jgi:hypothetical protein
MLYETVSGSEVKITGLLDWDAECVCFIPKFMAYSAPWWLWGSADPEALAWNETQVLNPSTSPEDVSNRLIWEAMAGAEWLRYAYKIEYVIARNAFAVLRTGMGYCWQLKDIKNALTEWNKLYPEDDVAEDDDFSMRCR